MARRVRTGCADCIRCTNTLLGNGARKAGRFTAGMLTMGLTEVATRKCRACGHVMSVHDRADNDPFIRNRSHRGQPVVWGGPPQQPAVPDSRTQSPPPPQGWMPPAPPTAPVLGAQPFPHQQGWAPPAPAAASAVTTYKGYGAVLAIDGDVLILTKKGVSSTLFGTTGVRRIPFQALAGVNFRDATRLINGCLQLVIGGEPAGRAEPSDPNTIVFLYGSQAQFVALRDYLLGVVARNRELGIDPSTVAYDPAPKTFLQRLEDKQAAVEAARDGIAWSFEPPAPRQEWPPSEPAPAWGPHPPAQQQTGAAPAPVPAPASQPVEQRPIDVATRLQQLEQLKTAGVITEYEYTEKRAAILAEL